MSIDWYRDLVIIISGVVLFVTLILITALLYSLYRRVTAALDSINATTKTIHEITSCVGDEVVKPMIQMAALVQGIRQGVDTVSKFFKKKGEKDV